MIVKDLLHTLNEKIPFSKAESWDNVGLLIGDETDAVKSILVTLDVTMEVVEEARSQGCNVIIAHHPLIFSGIKQINAAGYTKVMRQLIKHDIHLIAMHTNLDAHPQGVSAMIGQRLGLSDMEILIKQPVELNKLQIFIPKSHVELLKHKLAQSGAGEIGDYSDCFFEVEGTGQFKPGEQANPFIGSSNNIEKVEEIKLECVFQPQLRRLIEQVIHQHHPYEEPAYDIMSFNVEDRFGTGIKGSLPEQINIETWLPQLKEQLGIDSVKLIGSPAQSIKTVGIIGGAGVSYLDDVLKADVDVFLTGDIKYHEAHDLLMAGQTTVDIQHYSEHVMKDGLTQLLTQWIDLPVFASVIETNPFKLY